MSKTSLLIVITKSPHGSSACHEALDLALATASFEQEIALAFEGDGLLCFKPDQNYAQSGRKNLFKMLKALPVFGIEALYVITDSSELNDEHVAGIPENSQQIRSDQRGELYARFDNVLHF
jgi:tRNA 2-thiouridine synthesizing protein C